MLTMSQRIETLRREKNLNKSDLSKALGFPANAIDRFESGRQTPNKAQQEKMANFFEVSIAYLRAETNDPTRQDSWMDLSYAAMEEPEANLAPKKEKAAPKAASQQSLEGPLFLAMLKNPETRAELERLVLQTLETAQGKTLIRRIVEEE